MSNAPPNARTLIEKTAVEIVTVSPSSSAAKLVGYLGPMLDYSKEIMRELRDSPNVLNGDTIALYGKLVDNLAELRVALQGRGLRPLSVGHISDDAIQALKREYAEVLSAHLTKIRKSCVYAREQADKVVEIEVDGDVVTRQVGYFDSVGIAWWYLRMDIPKLLGTAQYTIRKWGQLLAYESYRNGERPDHFDEFEDYQREMQSVQGYVVEADGEEE